MNSIRTRLFAAAFFLFGATAQAQTATHSVYLDLDRNTATGCSIVTPAGTIFGAEARVTATVTGQPPQVSSVVRETCVANAFVTPQAQPSGYPVGINLGQGGSDMVEFSTTLTGLPVSGPANLSFLSSTATGADIATAQGVALPGAVISPTIIPATGLIGLLLLIGVVLWVARKHPKFGSSMGLLLLLGAGVVWAANFVMDGQAGDWTGETPRALDASNDSTSGEGTIDLVAVYAETEAGRLFLRADVREAQSLAPAFTSATTTTFTVGTAGTFTVAATGTPTPTLSLSGGTLPAGVNFNAATGVLSGTPGAGTGGTHPLQFTATNSQGVATQNFTLLVNQAPAITSANAATFNVGAAGSFPVTASGFPAPTFALTGALPTGVTLNPTSGVLGGTPAAGTGGTYAVTITATNAAGSSAPQNFTLTVNDGPVFTSAATTTFTVGTAGTFTVAATGTPAPTLSLTNGTLPTGVSFTAATGVLSGTPAAGTGGSHVLEFTATNAQGTTTQAFTLVVNEAPAITSANSTNFTVGNVSSFTVVASGFPAPTFALTGALPTGITFNTTTGVLSGTPAAATGGSYPLTFTATNAAGSSAPQNFTLTINDGPVFTSANTTTFSVGVAGNFIVTATGTPAPTLSLTNGTLPPNVTFTAATGVLSGTPAVGTGGSYTLEFTATNAQGTTTQNFTFLVNEAPTVTSANSVTFTVGAAGSFTFTAGGFPASTFALSGCVPALPASINLNPTSGVLSGTPASGQGGSYACTVTASNGVAPNATQGFTLTINQAPQITSLAATTFTVGSNGNFTVTAIGTPTPTLSIAGALPSGVSFAPATGLLSGTPANGAGGSYPITFTATNGVAPDATQNFTLTVNEAPEITSAAAATFTLNNPSSFTVTADGFPASTFAITGALPTGITFNPGSGVLSGTPTTTGTFALTFQATNVAGSSVVQNFTLSVNDGPVFTSANTTTFTVGVAGNFIVTATGTPTPTLSLSNGTLPANVTFTPATGALSGTPAVGTGGSYALEFSATNVQGTSTQNFTLLVNEAPTITSANATTFAVGAAGSFTFTASGFPASTFALSGCVLPGTISLNPTTGVLSGTPTPADGGSYACTVTASNGVAPNATQGFTLTINQAPAITSANATTFTVGTNGNFTVTATGTPTPTLSQSGALPLNVTFTPASGLLSGTPAVGTGGSYPITFTAANGVLPDATQNFTLTVNEAPTITSANNTAFSVGSAGSFTVTATGFPAPTLSLGACAPALPGSISFTPGTGVLAGTPATGEGGSYVCPITASNGVGTDATQNFTLTINQAPVANNDAGAAFTADSGSTLNLPAGTLFADNGSGADVRGFPLAAIASFGGGSAGGAVTDTAAGSADTTIPGFTNGSLTINADGSLAFTPPTTATRFCGTFTVNYRLTNTQGSDDATVTITVRCAPIAQNDLFAGGFTGTASGLQRSGDLFANNGSGADDLGSPAATLTSFGGGSLGGTVTSNAAGASVAFASGTLTVNANGTLSVVDVDTAGTFTFDYRLTNASGTDDGTVTFTFDAPPMVASTVPVDNAVNVPNNSDITVNFSETVTLAAGAISVDCGAGAVAGALSGSGTATGTFNPTANLPGNATCTVTVVSANVTDTDTNDAPDTLDGDGNGIEGGNFVFDFQVAPTANDDAVTVTPHLSFLSPTSVKANDDPITLTITGFGDTLATANGTVPNGTNFITAGGAGGRVVLNLDGTFSYLPDAGDSSTVATFFYTVTGGDTAQVTITLQAQQLIWFADDNAASPVCTGTNVGTQACPATTTAAAVANDTADDTLFFAAGSYNCGIALLANERLVGDGTSGITLQTVSGVTPAAGSSLPAFGGTAPTFSSAADCVTLATGNVLRGFTIGDTGAANTDITGTAFGTVTIDQVTLSGTGRALNLTTGTLSGGGFTSVASTSSNTTGITLTGIGGAFGFGSTTVSNSTTQGILVGTTSAVLTFGNTSVSGGTDGISLGNNPSGTFNFGTITRTGGGSGLLHSVNGGDIAAGATTISGTSGLGIDITGHLTPNTIVFGATSATKAAAGGAINLGTALAGNTGTVTFAELSGTTSNGAFLVGTNNTGTLTVTAASANPIAATGGPALNIDAAPAAGSPVSLTLGVVSSTNSATQGINLNNITGTLSVAGGSISAPTGVGFLGQGTLGTVTYPGSITKATDGNLVQISGAAAGTVTLSGNLDCTSLCDGIDVLNRTGGTITFSGASKVLNTSASAASPAVNLDNNDAAQIHFTGGGLDIDSTSGNGFNAINGATQVTVQGANNSIVSTTGIALNVTGSTIGGPGLTFQSVAANGGSSGIVLSATGGGGLTVTGSSAGLCGGQVGAGPPASAATTTAPVVADCTGGTIQGTTGPGIILSSASNVSLTRMRVINGGNDGVQGTNVTGFSLISSFFDNNGDAINESGLDFGDTSSVTPDGLHGTGVITNSTIQNSFYNGASIRNLSGAALTAFTVTGSQFRANPADPDANDQLFMEAGGTANMALSATGNFFASVEGDHFQAAALNSGVLNVGFTNNTLAGGHATPLGQGITINAATGVPGWTGRIDYDVNGNNIVGAVSNGAAMVLGTSSAAAVFDGFARNNLVGASGAALSCSTQANAVYIDARGNGTHNASIANNTLRQCFDRGVLSEAGDGDSVLNFTMTDNVVDQQVAAGAREAIQTNHGITATNVFGNVDTNVVCLQIGGAGALDNNLSHGGGAPDDFRLRKRQEATVRLPGYAGGTDQTAGSLAQVVAHKVGQNVGSAGEPGSASATGAGGGYTGGAACPLPL